MVIMRWIPFIFLAAACDPVTENKPDQGTVSADDTGSGSIVFVDEDRDGVSAEDDCDDNDYRVYPGAEEVCDGADNDCDGEVDNGFDPDGDGYFDMSQCEDGLDCNEADPEIPGTESPYDGIDQDCDGQDLTDVDGDGFDGRAGGGNDCDDFDRDVYPSAPEVPRDGVDQDCNGVDLIDGDGDGFDASSHGGDDCDDDDASVNPDAVDWFHDGVDSNCDDVDGGLFEARFAPAVIVGDPGEHQLLGHDVSVCDLDSDGLSDLVVSAPYAGDYQGAVGVFYGRNAADWSGNMRLSQAGTHIMSVGSAFGFGAVCADVNGDGNDDLVIGQGEIQFGPFVSDYAVRVFYGVGGMLSAEMDEADADAVYSFDLGAPGGVGEVQAGRVTAVDLGGDGAAEIIVDHDVGNTDFGPSAIWVIPGADRVGSYDMDELVLSSIADPQGDTVTRIVGVGERIAVGQGRYAPGLSGGDSTQSGKVAWIPLTGGDFDSISDAAEFELSMDGPGALGSSMSFGDFDADGLDDVVVGAPAAEGGMGAVYMVSDLESIDGGPSTDAMTATDVDAVAAYRIVGAEGGFGVGVAAGGDIDGDGVADVLVAEEDADGIGVVWVVSGTLLAEGDNDIADVSVLGIRAQYSNEQIGQTMLLADLDGDGVDDMIVGSSNHPTPASVGLALSGRVAVFLSSEF
jgi:hypothetical protein